jgi:hypothetical protein
MRAARWLAYPHPTIGIFEESRFALDSSLEEAGFEPSVPPDMTMSPLPDFPQREVLDADVSRHRRGRRTSPAGLRVRSGLRGTASRL